MSTNTINPDAARDERRQRAARYMRQYRALHPERIYKQRLRDAARLLRRNGYTVEMPAANDANGGEGGEDNGQR